MKVLRTSVLETETFEIGDKISFELDGFGTFSATAQEATENGTLFLFDSIVAERRMYDDWPNVGGYEHSDLNVWLKEVLLKRFSEDIRSRIKDISIPSVGQTFGHDYYLDSLYEPDGDNQFPSMKICKDRTRFYADVILEYWLKNKRIKFSKIREEEFATVWGTGQNFFEDATSSCGVLPVILLK